MKRLKNPSVEEILNESEPIPFSGCFIFNRSINSGGYGRLKSNGVEFLAHRYVWSKINGGIPKGLFVCHACDTPGCVNPAHLFIGTPRDNYDDMLKKGRAPFDGPPATGRFKIGNAYTPDIKGEKHHNAKLTKQEVIYIRESNLSITDLMRKFNVSRGCIRKIISRQNWTHI
ncbi:MAG: hypothetical protein GX086_07165 [Alcaligenaceae bacterium]|nr:hypothetical protein [Alcaligenaceae bacterium]